MKIQFETKYELFGFILFLNLGWIQVSPSEEL